MLCTRYTQHTHTYFFKCVCVFVSSFIFSPSRICRKLISSKIIFILCVLGYLLMHFVWICSFLLLPFLVCRFMFISSHFFFERYSMFPLYVESTHFYVRRRNHCRKKIIVILRVVSQCLLLDDETLFLFISLIHLINMSTTKKAHSTQQNTFWVYVRMDKKEAAKQNKTKKNETVFGMMTRRRKKKQRENIMFTHNT